MLGAAQASRIGHADERMLWLDNRVAGYVQATVVDLRLDGSDVFVCALERYWRLAAQTGHLMEAIAFREELGDRHGSER